MIRAHHRLKGGAAQLGAAGPGQRGPFGVWPDDHPEDEDQESPGGSAFVRAALAVELGYSAPADRPPQGTEALAGPVHQES